MHSKTLSVIISNFMSLTCITSYLTKYFDMHSKLCNQRSLPLLYIYTNEISCNLALTLFTCLIYIHHENFCMANTEALLSQLVFVAKIYDYYSGINSYSVDIQISVRSMLFVGSFFFLCC